MSRPCTFTTVLRKHGLDLSRDAVSVVQINLGRLCNQACTHCHIGAGPGRKEIMSVETAQRLLQVIAASSTVESIDVTGGAPELNPHFRYLVEKVKTVGLSIMVRTNLTVFFEPGMNDLPGFYRRRGVHLVASLPCYSEDNVNHQRGRGVFEKSIQALQWLNREGYGRSDSGLVLDLVYNPIGPALPPPQGQLEEQYKAELRSHFGIEFNRLLTLTNMPIGRFADRLDRKDERTAYLDLLAHAFNPLTVPNLMCRTLVSIGWDGQIYDCDFNQALGRSAFGSPKSIWQIDSFEELASRSIVTGPHCFGCTAGSGSSCGGALV